MAALTTPRNTLERVGPINAFPLKANTTVQQGSLVVLDAGYAAPGRTATGLIAAGRAESSATAVAAGSAQVPVKVGTFKFGNSTAADLVTQAEVGTDCYIVDDQTVAKTSGGATRSIAGKIIAIDSDGVWVKVGAGL